MVDDNDGTMTKAERDAVKERAAEVRRQARKLKGEEKAKADLQDVLDKIAEMPDDERAIAERLHGIILREAPELAPKTWYGMPAYARDGKVIVFFQPGSKFGARYNTLGFNDGAALDEGDLWATGFALTALGETEEQRIVELIARAIG